MKYLAILLLSLCFCTVTWGQHLKDTMKIKSVLVKNRQISKNENNVGARNSSIGKAILDVTQTQSLAELLSENSLVYIKSMGQGALATSSFRGTSSNHTQVNWNGISINSPMLGNFDFSQVPAIFTDEVMLYHGASYLKGGTGALGGSINLNNAYDGSTKESEFRVLSEYGSNATFTEAISARFSVNKLTSSTRLFYQQSENNFEYLNKVLSKDQFYERRTDAQYRKWGVMQQFYYDLPNQGLLSANVWYQWDDRNLPQPIMAYKTSKENQISAALRSYIKYEKQREKSNFDATFAYLNDDSDYTRKFENGVGDSQTKNRSHSAIVKGSYTYRPNPKTELNASANYRYDQVIAENYAENKVSRNTVSLQVGAIWKPIKKLMLNAQLMGEINGDKSMPTYSVGANYAIVEKLLSVKVSNAYNYRHPTLNDLYWTPGGNPSLKPEKGFSYDATLSLTPSIGKVKFGFDATYYRMDISNWIMWIPTNNGYLWEPQNFNNVLSQGMELTGTAKFKTGEVYHRLTVNYAYSPSVDNSERKDPTYKKQLPYVPLNRWNARYALQWNGLSFNYNVSFTDVRYTSSDQSYSTNAYTTHDAEVSYDLKTGKRGLLKFALRVDNIADAYYESTQYYPMPLRSYFGSMQFTF